MRRGLPTAWSAAPSRSPSPLSQGKGRRIDRTTTWVVGVSVLLVLTHLLVDGVLAPWQRLLSAIPGIVAAVLTGTYFRRRDFSRLPFVEYAAVQFYAYWGFSTLTYRGGARGTYVSEGSETAALIAVNLVVILVALAHPIGLRLGHRIAPIIARTLPSTPPAKIKYFYAGWVGLAFAVHAGWAVDAVPPEYRNVINLLGSFVPLVVYAAMEAQAGKGARARLWLTASLLAIAGFFTGMMEQVIVPLLVVALVDTLQRRTIPVRLALVGALLVVLINPTKHAYRQIAWSRDSTNVERDPVAALANWTEAFKRTWLEDNAALRENVETVGGRFGEFAYITPTFELCPSVVPFRRGADWGYIPLAFVPRALYPDKPDYTEIFNNRFNVAFGFQTIDMTKTSTSSFPLVADGYWNLGWPGVVIVGLLAGVALGLFGGALTTRSWGTFSLAAMIFSEMHAQGHLARLWIGVLQQYVAVAVVCWTVWFFGMGFARGRAQRRDGMAQRSEGHG